MEFMSGPAPSAGATMCSPARRHAGTPPCPLGPLEQPQRQPLARVHAVTGRRALYMCEYVQMDWVEGPIASLSPGHEGEGAKLLHELTQEQFLYVHEWTMGDLVVWDNRCLVHAATWFDVTTHERVMWRTTVSGNPGAIYTGERKSWLAA